MESSLEQRLLSSLQTDLGDMLSRFKWHPAHQKALLQAQSSLKSIEFVAKRSLVVLDLNGVLLDREFVDGKKDGIVPEPDCFAGKFAVWFRPELQKFLSALMEDYEVAIWSSAKLFNVQQLVDVIAPKDLQKKFIFIWGQEECTAVKTEEKHPDGKPVMLFTKPVTHIWESFPQYQRKTIIIDDSSEKVKSDCLRHVQTWTRKDVDRSALDLLTMIKAEPLPKEKSFYCTRCGRTKGESHIGGTCDRCGTWLCDGCYKEVPPDGPYYERGWSNFCLTCICDD